MIPFFNLLLCTFVFNSQYRCIGTQRFGYNRERVMNYSFGRILISILASKRGLILFFLRISYIHSFETKYFYSEGSNIYWTKWIAPIDINFSFASHMKKKIILALLL